MKRLNLIFLLIGLIFFFGCQKDNTVTTEPNQSDEVTTSLKAAKVHTHFIGICTPIEFVSPTKSIWYDDTDDDRVTGVSFWETESVVPIDEVTFELSGTTELFVGVEVDDDGEYSIDDNDGKWEMTWKGTQTLTSPDGSTFRIVAHAVGDGIGGIVEGMTAKWKYTLDFDGTPQTLHYHIKGKITEDRE